MTQKEMVQKIKSDYLLKQKQAELFAERQKNKARQDKVYLKLELEERSLILDISKTHFLNKDAGELEKKLQTVKTLKLKRLKELNIDPISLTPQYNCQKCKDTGFVNHSYCNCFKQAYNNLRMKLSNISFENIPSLKDYNLEVFEEKTQKQMKKVVNLCEKLLKNYKNTKITSILFSGQTGVGKTYLSKIIAKEAMQKGYTSYYTTAFGLNNAMLKYHTTFDDNKQSYLSPLLDSDLLIIDDLGTEPILKNVTLEYLLLILNERSLNAKKTIINTNLSPNDILNRYSERIFSRLMNKQTSLLIKVDGCDLRLKK